ncbi:ubiquitin fusion degradation protein UFD1, putative [Plasmodium ovale wallikeri]|uniref:Ubiquitin fusion degradation protein UFD1, putative n=1 Tax=Plasmodium ovale wallikeri TaxID=864142 RepID=A0A1A8YX11_PLAOA|nr:ubiquitin fusion degradation protein UFD1, putative [Plasmodium ovale wallikeri]SBT36466.1 ubiquitin fusion degradation protein UFD1, putative [Plasmodium ovale wallikeri]
MPHRLSTFVLPFHLITLQPVSILKTLEKGFYKSEVEFPYTFSLKNIQNNYITHACVLEFSSNEGIIQVSDNIKENLGITETNGVVRILVTYANLPKCDFIKFEALSENINDIKFMKNLLENELSLNYCTLTLGDHVHINHLDFYISDLEPDNAVSLINTDITVDICERTNMIERNDSQSNCKDSPYEVINNTETTFSNSIIKGGMKKYKFVINYAILEMLKKDKIDLNISLNSSSIKNFNMFISFPPYDSVSEIMHHLHVHDCSKEIKINKDIITKCLRLHFVCFQRGRTHDNCCERDGGDGGDGGYDDDDSFLDYIFDQFFPHIVYIGVLSNCETELQYTLSSSIDYDNKKIPGGQGDNRNVNQTSAASGESETNGKTITNELPISLQTSKTYVKCDNCLKEILENNISMHQIHCLKNISLCNICKRTLKKKEISEHMHCDICNEGINMHDKNDHNLMWHTKIKCICQKYFYRKQFIFHQNLFCSKKIIFCSFCNIFTVSSTNFYNEDYVLANFFDKFDNKKDFSEKSIDYYFQLLHNNFPFFIKYISSTEHEKYCGSKSVTCLMCKQTMYRNNYLTHLNVIHNVDKKESFKIITENANV